MHIIEDIKLASYLETHAANFLKLIVRSEKDIQCGNVTDQDVVFKRIEDKLRCKNSDKISDLTERFL